MDLGEGMRAGQVIGRHVNADTPTQESVDIRVDVYRHFLENRRESWVTGTEVGRI